MTNERQDGFNIIIRNTYTRRMKPHAHDDDSIHAVTPVSVGDAMTTSPSTLFARDVANIASATFDALNVPAVSF